MPKISELANGAPVQTTDALVIQRGGFNYSATVANLFSGYNSQDLTITGNWNFANDSIVFYKDGGTPGEFADQRAAFFTGTNFAYFFLNSPRGAYLGAGSTGAATGDFAALQLFTSRGVQGGPWAPLQVGDKVGEIFFDALDANDTGDASTEDYRARITAIVETQIAGTAQGVGLHFSIGPDGTTSTRKALAINQDGGLTTYDGTETAAIGGSQGAGTINSKGLYVDGVPANLPPTVVASLPTAVAGARGFVTDSNATLATGHGNIVAGGGANFVPVYSDGTNWRIG